MFDFSAFIVSNEPTTVAKDEHTSSWYLVHKRWLSSDNLSLKYSVKNIAFTLFSYKVNEF